MRAVIAFASVCIIVVVGLAIVSGSFNILNAQDLGTEGNRTRNSLRTIMTEGGFALTIPLSMIMAVGAIVSVLVILYSLTRR